MKNVLDDIERWQKQGRRIALGRLVDTEGSGPRDPGATMAVNEDGEVTGSVSGGCVESAVVSEALSVLSTGIPRICTFGYPDEDAFAVGLTCGGTMRIFIEPLADEVGDQGKSAFALVRDAVTAGQPIALVSVVEVAETTAGSLPALGSTIVVRPGMDPFGALSDACLDRAVVADALAVLEAGRNTVRHYGAQGGPGHDVTVFIEVFQTPRRMLIFGAVDFSAALVRAAVNLGYYVVVCDAREVFASARRFPEADEVVVEWPHLYLERVGHALGPRDAICVLTHDHKFDVPALVAGLDTRVGYLGAMGSRRTHAERIERLREEGVEDAALTRIMSPIGIDIGARTPEETAVAILAEIIAAQSVTPVPSLRDRIGPIHRRAL